MKCSHNKPLTASSLDTQCKKCKNSIVLRSNREIVEAVFSGEGKAIFKVLFGRLMDWVTLPSSDSDHAVIEMIEQRLRSEDMRRLEVLDAMRPRLIFYDKAKGCVYVLNPFIGDQRWSKLIEAAGPSPRLVKTVLTRLLTRREAVVKSELAPAKTAYMIPVALIVPFRKGQTRRQSSPSFRQEMLDTLGESLVQDKQVTPIIVRQFRNQDGVCQYELLAGERRTKAAQRKGLKFIEGFVLPENTSDEEALRIVIVENAHRFGLTPVEVALEACRLQNMGWKTKDIARVMGKNPLSIYQITPLGKLSEKVVDAINAASSKISVAQALLLVKVPNEKDQLRAIAGWLQYRATNKSSHRDDKQGGTKSILDFAMSKKTVDGVPLTDEDFKRLLKRLTAGSSTIRKAAKELMTDNNTKKLKDFASRKFVLLSNVVGALMDCLNYAEQVKKLIEDNID